MKYLSGIITAMSLMPGLLYADATVNFKGTVIEAPPCVVSNNQLVTVDFGDEVMTTRVDGSNYKQPIRFTLDCSEALSSKQKIRITGETAGFDPISLSTSVSSLAVALYHDDVRYTPGEWIPFTDPDVPALYAVPVKQDSATLSGGAFSVLASLVVDYQ
ncbi:fimbrial protein [Enterobacter sp. Acro-832]|uniref:fimbrial protein n=1 Tax=Enterobacter sp. Acro-832 TaxID=2608348 RepID=UPI00141F08F0|nr:fimbrial protein [Enterobacter sp. Acro-832]NIG46427.1 fimbrial protein [Enterobacter sp. Acro-832]